MPNPLYRLFEAPGTTAAAVMPSGADPESARALMIVGAIIIITTALWAAGGLIAAVWVRLNSPLPRQLPSRVRGRAASREAAARIKADQIRV